MAYHDHAEQWPSPRILDGSTDFRQVLVVQMWIMLSCQDHPVVTGLSEDGHIHSFLVEYSVRPKYIDNKCEKVQTLGAAAQSEHALMS